ncbi:cell wall / vacuolar inhibitor of fructosidase 1-like [Mercurialis annua]|uniref:cell wall / vacuolar inhibitor of fructosidase 1-like n=1 Tax=Mercurialis annua TaxID=3986 RepID=UPI00215F0DF8|nr:cell wall / vacuolar inhibitor of fructosidase 1-like [Mercurialis annua]
MMNPLISFSSTPLLLLLLLLFLLPPLIRTNDMIDKTCKKTPHYDLCISSLRSNAQNSDTDVKGLASVMANITLFNATETLHYLLQLINRNTDAELERQLTYCAEAYIPIVDYILPQAIDAILNCQFGFAKYGIAYAENEARACEDKISGSVKLDFVEMNRVMQKLCDICVAIINILLKN